MSRDDLENLLSLLARWIQPSPWGREAIGVNDGLHFSGGEPFLNFELLLEATRIAEELGTPSTFVETNCSWCSDDAGTTDRLRMLRDVGLKGILISVNPFYAEYVPFERTERCIRVSQEIFGRNVIVYQAAYYHQFRRLGIRGRLPLEEYLASYQGARLGEQVETFLMGRAARELRDLYPKHPAPAFFDAPCHPPFLRDWHNHFDNYGNFMPGFCGGISLGSWRDLDALVREGIDTDEHPVLGFLLSEDMSGLYGFCRDFGYQERADGYLSRCDLCLDLRHHLVTRGNWKELSPREFYVQLDREEEPGRGTHESQGVSR